MDINRRIATAAGTSSGTTLGQSEADVRDSSLPHAGCCATRSCRFHARQTPRERGGPPFVKLGAAVRYPADLLEAWIDRHDRYTSTNVAFSDSGSETYVSIAGQARTLNDRALIRKFWNPFYKAWFEGPDDPTIRVTEVTPSSAEYWITKGGKIVSLLSVLASAVTGKDMEVGKNKTIEM